MSSFQIHQDAEKENPRIPIKDRAGTRPNAALGGALKDKQAGGRSDFAVLNPNANGGNGGRLIVGGAGNAKVAFREVGNVKPTDGVALVGIHAAAAATKKSTVVPVVEQFKAFTVYEDQSEQPQHVSATQLHQQQQQKLPAESIAASIDKENVFSVTEQQQQRIAKSDKGSDDLNEDDSILDSTAMSVSEMLSPMSVDRSVVSQQKPLPSIDNRNTQLQQQQAELPLPRNDRQRFFEVVEYQHAILDYFRDSEKKHRPKPNYMLRQSDINYSMRTILVDWLVEVSEEYNLDTETLYLSVSYVDRFLSQMSVMRSKLQLVGTAAMYIASKYEEIYPPDVGEFVFITDDTYNKAQVLRMEQIILKILAFDLCTPTIFVFINMYAVIGDMPDQVKLLTQYICELSLLEADPFLNFLPSIISASSLALARYILDCPIWSPELEEITTYRLEDLKQVLLHLCKSHNAAATLAQQAIQEKYKAEKYKQVSTIKPVQFTEENFDEITRKYNELKSNNSPVDQEAEIATTSENVRRMISLMFN